MHGIEDRLGELEHRSGRRPWRRWAVRAASAAAVFLLAAGLYFGAGNGVPVPAGAGDALSASAEAVLPGGNRAVLSLSDGSTIVLDSVGNGLLATLDGTSVRKAADGRVVLRELDGHAPPSPHTRNRLTTPRGGQYSIVLPDGTKVWLNAASTLAFPASFSASERRGELTGEAYFEVSNNPAAPYRGASGGPRPEE